MDNHALLKLLEREQIDLFELAEACGGYYKTPYNAEGQRVGPLVAYADKDPLGRQYVGEEYFNFAMIERHSRALGRVVDGLLPLLTPYAEQMTTFFAAPEGGKALATLLADRLGKYYVYPKKKVTAPATEDQPEQSELVYDRHGLEPGERVMIVEDIPNEFSTTLRMIKMIIEQGAEVVGLVCALNRSMKFDKVFFAHGIRVPVFSLVCKHSPQYQQGDRFVAADAQAGNVVWNPKSRSEWNRLMEFMEATR